MDPLRSFLPRRVTNPLMGSRPSVLERSDTLMGERHSLVICSDGWKDFLGSVFRLISPALSACLARAGGRG